jgi:hypothetical protein
MDIYTIHYIKLITKNRIINKYVLNDNYLHIQGIYYIYLLKELNVGALEV